MGCRQDEPMIEGPEVDPPRAHNQSPRKPPRRRLVGTGMVQSGSGHCSCPMTIRPYTWALFLAFSDRSRALVAPVPRGAEAKQQRQHQQHRWGAQTTEHLPPGQDWSAAPPLGEVALA